ncbi:MAG: DUF1579 domain-containing protein [Candidatus Latescibacteria bacterium]|nr:DUF1579 domain-containing protein [Candidatus Latescibacterota bacterium]
MNARWLGIVFCFALIVSLGTPVTAAEPAKGADAKATPAAAPTEEEMMAAMMKASTPGPMHDLMKSMVGSWKAVTKSWSGPGEPTVTEGTSENTLILGGRYLQSAFKGMFGGMPFEGVGIMGYNNQKKQFESVWVDNMGTAVAWSHGSVDPVGKVITMNATFPDPMTGQDTSYKMVTTIVDANQHQFAMVGSKDGKDRTEMEITYTRVK